MTNRIRLIQIFVIGWSLLLIGRLTYWQIVKAADLKEAADIQHFGNVILSASRGKILASDKFPLVTNQDNYLYFVNPKHLPRDLTLLSKIIENLPSSESAKNQLTIAASSPLSWIVISREISPAIKKNIEDLAIPGSGFELEPERSYPEGSPSAYITGFVGKDEQNRPKGYFGLEGYYDRQLSGINGKIIQEKDAFGRPITIADQVRIPPQEGRTLITSIDRTILYTAYQKLTEGLQKYQASGGSVTILESQTGRVLAMVSLPGYDASDFSMFPSTLYKNPIVSDSYEPGSTFKTVIMSSALDAEVVTQDTICDICTGPVTINGATVGSWNNQYYPQSNMTEVILHSDNVGMVFVSRKLGKDKMLSYLKKFGIGQPTNIDQQEESISRLRPDSEWRDIDLATASFGQGIAVTPLQMAVAVNAIANHGRLVHPRIVDQIISDQFSQPTKVAPVSQVISEYAAAKMTEMMVNGVRKGEVRYYRPPGYMIAGKTGTAQVPIEGHYDQNKTIASFVGFAPADNPIFTMLVTLQNPQASPWGSTTAAPVWFSIATELFRYYQIPPTAGM